MPSHLDELTYPFQCENPKCGQQFKETLRRLIQLDEIVCPKCGMKKDIRESKRTGDLGTWFSTAGELDKLRKLEKKD